MYTLAPRNVVTVVDGKPRIVLCWRLVSSSKDEHKGSDFPRRRSVCVWAPPCTYAHATGNPRRSCAPCRRIHVMYTSGQRPALYPAVICKLPPIPHVPPRHQVVSRTSRGLPTVPTPYSSGWVGRPTTNRGNITPAAMQHVQSSQWATIVGAWVPGSLPTGSACMVVRQRARGCCRNAAPKLHTRLSHMHAAALRAGSFPLGEWAVAGVNARTPRAGQRAEPPLAKGKS